jgi:DNA-binding NarL/FixJ family response regulator
VGIVDDHPVVVDGLSLAISRVASLTVAATGSTMRDAEAMLARDDLDVILLDIRLPDGNGLELLARTAETRATPVVVLSSFQSSQYIAAAVRFGAQGFLLKTAPAAEIISTLQRVVTHGTGFTASQLRGAGASILTRRERALVRLVVEGRSNSEIAAAFNTSRKTVESQLSRLYSRMGVMTRVELAIQAEREGWLEVGPMTRDG